MFDIARQCRGQVKAVAERTASRGMNPLGCLSLAQEPTGGGGDGVPTESISLAFEAFEEEYQEQGPDGAAKGGAVTGGFNALVNKES